MEKTTYKFVPLTKELAPTLDSSYLYLVRRNEENDAYGNKGEYIKTMYSDKDFDAGYCILLPSPSHSGSSTNR